MAKHDAEQPNSEQERLKVLEINLNGVTRRQLLGLMGLGLGAAALSACGGTDATTTKGTGAGTTGGGAATAATGAGAPATKGTGAGTTGGGASAPAAGVGGKTFETGYDFGKKGGAIHGGTNLELPPAGHHNFFVATKLIGNDFWAELEHLAPAWYQWADDKYAGALAEKWGFQGGDTYEFTLKKDLKWSNDKPVTSKDVVATWILNRLFNNQAWRYLDKVTAKDDQTIAFHMSKPASVVERYVLRQRIRPASIYGEWADKLVPLYEAGKDNTADDVKKLRTDFEAFRPTERLATGPYIMDLGTLTEASVEYKRNPKGLNGDTVLFDKIKLYVGETPVSTPLVLSKEMDFVTNGFAVATDKQMQTQKIRVLRTAIHSGPAIHFNYDDNSKPEMKVWKDKRVRQAVAYAINRKDNGVLSLGQSGKGLTYMAGVSDTILPKWMSEADLKKLNTYEYDQKKAADLLQQAGCKKQGDQWMDPSGKPMAYDLIEPAEFQDWSAAAQDWADQMTKFGIKITVRAITFTQIPEDRKTGKFQLAVDGWGSGQPHPHFSFVSSLLNKVQPLANGPYMSFDLKQKTDTVGDIDFQDLITASAEGLDVNAQKDKVAKVALAYNELLPTIPIWERYANGPALEGVRVKQFPPDGELLYENDLYNDAFITRLIFDGKLGSV